MSWTIYFLSVADSLGSALSGIAMTCLFVLVMGAVLSPIVLTDIGSKDHALTAKRAAKWVAIIGLACAVLAGAIPSRRDLIEAYVIVEGSKVITADNAEAFTKETVKRIDALIAKIGGDK